MMSGYATILRNIIHCIETEVLFQVNFKGEYKFPTYLGNSPHRVKEENNIKRIIEHYYGPKISVVIEREKYRTLYILRIVKEEEKNES